jgi:MoxR-like ATPase
MAKKLSSKSPSSTDEPLGAPAELQRPAIEVLYAGELQRLIERDAGQPRPGGWQMTPRSVLDFVLGSDALGIQPKFVGRKSFLERCIVALATNRGLMLIGEPGTAKSYLSELLAAAVCGDSTLTIQGSAGTTEDNIKYSWNYALLVSAGPSEQSLVPAPLYFGLKHGKIVRFEEITRCPLEIQDTLLSVLSDRVMSIPELDGEARTLFARTGFNVIATANTRDRGVNDMSAALKRRFNFETVQPIESLAQEMELVERETNRMLRHAAVPVTITPPLTELLVTAFRELRNGKTVDGKGIEGLSTVLSTAEAVSTGFAAAMHAYYYDNGSFRPNHLVQHMLGAVLKDNPDDLKKVRGYFNHVVKSRGDAHWKAFYEAREILE